MAEVKELWAANGLDRLKRFHADPDFAATAEKAMDEHPVDLPPPPAEQLEPLHFKGFLRSEVKFRNGMAELVFQVPYEDRNLAVQMVAYSGRVLEVYVRPMVMDRRYD